MGFQKCLGCLRLPLGKFENSRSVQCVQLPFQSVSNFEACSVGLQECSSSLKLPGVSSKTFIWLSKCSGMRYVSISLEIFGWPFKVLD